METKSSAITEREIQVLCALVRAHVALRAPVGSRTLCEQYGVGASAATIRNAREPGGEGVRPSAPYLGRARADRERISILRYAVHDGRSIGFRR